MFQNELAIRFENVIENLLAGETVNLHAENISVMFEAIATNLLASNPGRVGCYFDGVSELTSTRRSPRKVEFTGEMWVGRDKSQWTEPFSASATDKRSTQQGIWIIIQIGQDRAEAELSSAFGIKT